MPKRSRSYRSAPAEIVKEKPSKLATISSHVAVPVLFSLALAFGAWVLAYSFGSPYALRIAAAVFVVGMVIFLFLYMMPSLVETETVSPSEQADESEYAKEIIELDIKLHDSDDQPRSLKRVEIPQGVELNAVEFWARVALRRESLAINDWSTQRGFTRAQYERWINGLIDMGMIQTVGGKRVLTNYGRATFKGLIEEIGQAED